MDGLEQLARRWEAEGATLRDRYADERGAALCQAHAEELRAAVVQAGRETVSLSRAAELSGHSVSALRGRLVRGQLTNQGQHYQPRIAIAELVALGFIGKAAAPRHRQRRRGPLGAVPTHG